uniref:eIF4G n=1 Tax=Arundo donax TaxID=35708 RepID=A0A0A9G5A8_ARUDO
MRMYSSRQRALLNLTPQSQPVGSYSQIPRSGSHASNRWQQKGLVPSPVTPMQIMHKANKKYVVGEVSNLEEVKQRQLNAILNKLTPRNFVKLFRKVEEVNIDNVATLSWFVSRVFHRVLVEQSFCEIYAKFCFQLALTLPDFREGTERITFRRLLLNYCQEGLRGVKGKKLKLVK